MLQQIFSRGTAQEAPPDQHAPVIGVAVGISVGEGSRHEPALAPGVRELLQYVERMIALRDTHRKCMGFARDPVRLAAGIAVDLHAHRRIVAALRRGGGRESHAA
jgi:hypothetical protein